MDKEALGPLEEKVNFVERRMHLAVCAMIFLVIASAVFAVGSGLHGKTSLALVWAAVSVVGIFALSCLTSAFLHHDGLVQIMYNAINKGMRARDFELIYREVPPTQEQANRVLKLFALRIRAAVEDPEEVEDEKRAYQELADAFQRRGYRVAPWEQMAHSTVREDPPVAHI